MRHKILLLACALIFATAAAAQDAPRNARVFNDATRLAALLHDLQVDVPVTEAMWRTIANEANVLANRIYARTRGDGRTAARDLRMHVREMRAAAMRGNAAEARRHAREALPFAHRVIEWAD